MKSKGSAAERELVAMFWEQPKWAALRIAGSGRMNFPCCDLLAGNGQKIFAIEVKSTKHKYQYIESDQMEQLKTFAATFGAKPLIAVKFSTTWCFYEPDDLHMTQKGTYVINKEHHNKHKTFSEIIETVL